MAGSSWGYPGASFEMVWGDATGAIGDSVTVLPLVVAIAVLTDLSLGLMVIWFGAFQLVWGVYYGVPMSVEPMKALAGLLIAGTLTTGEFLVAGLLAGVILVGIGSTRTLQWLSTYLGERVVRGIQFAVALLLLETGLGLAVKAPPFAAAAVVAAVAVTAIGYWKLSALVILAIGGGIAGWQTGWPTMTVPAITLFAHLSVDSVTQHMVGATAGQLAMTVGNAAVATSLLVSDYFDRDVSPDSLATSMGVMNLIAVPLGGLPMCHGSGGVAGKYAFGARTATANFILGITYLVVALSAVSLVVTYPLSMLGVILVLISVTLAKTSFGHTSDYSVVMFIGLLGFFVTIGVAFLGGVILHLLLKRYEATR